MANICKSVPLHHSSKYAILENIMTLRNEVKLQQLLLVEY